MVAVPDVVVCFLSAVAHNNTTHCNFHCGGDGGCIYLLVV